MFPSRSPSAPFISKWNNPSILLLLTTPSSLVHLLPASSSSSSSFNLQRKSPYFLLSVSPAAAPTCSVGGLNHWKTFVTESFSQVDASLVASGLITKFQVSTVSVSVLFSVGDSCQLTRLHGTIQIHKQIFSVQFQGPFFETNPLPMGHHDRPGTSGSS